MTGTELVEYEKRTVSNLNSYTLGKYLQEQMQLMREYNSRLVAAGRKSAYYDVESAVLTTMIVKNEDGTMQAIKRDRPIYKNVFGVPSVGASVASNAANIRDGKYNDADLLIVQEEQNIEFKEIGDFMHR